LLKTYLVAPEKMIVTPGLIKRQSIERLIIGIKFIVSKYNDSIMGFDNSWFRQKKSPTREGEAYY
jgi:hypothetical protein